ncbi:TPA: hypothetical protein N0F65_003677 [Lagenidium giganteum]|uniref:Lipase-like C-terminal domain-containing protein n=1 Tax=Lagenidium giganteum TaxID=4803 RepID=A0AAV2YVQ1_9STRA|nr:TPA: hypothetical protein N0F65_003677 [Lagenidium giganteum]
MPHLTSSVQSPNTAQHGSPDDDQAPGGIFGYGKTKPFWNMWKPYWPEQALHEMNANHFLLDVGALSSNHDRACEAFYQLYGGTVDYGEAHSEHHDGQRLDMENDDGVVWDGMGRDTCVTATHIRRRCIQDGVRATRCGATAAIELYQLICTDAFGVGSTHEWVASITSVAGPLSGTTMTHLFEIHSTKMVPYSLGHAISTSLGLWYTLCNDFPILKRVYDYRMPQWRHVHSYLEVVAPTGRLNNSVDLTIFDIMPIIRMERNSRLVHMDKPFLVSIATSSHVQIPTLELVLLAVLLALLPACVVAPHVPLALAVVVAVTLFRRVQQLDFAAIPTCYAMMWAMRRRVRSLHQIFDDFHAPCWESNDGVVNLVSMLKPSFPRQLLKNSPKQDDSDDDWSDAASTASSSSSCASDPQDAPTEHEVLDALYDHQETASRELRRGRWYVHHVKKNHMAGTYFDSGAPEMYRNLFRLITERFEQHTDAETDNRSSPNLVSMDAPARSANASTTTRFPVVLIHGVFGYGKTKPFFNTWPPYWPEKELHEMNPNHVFVDLGMISSDYDRACELFHQLRGGRVDYGEEHSKKTKHSRYGETYERALHPNWSADNPVHLVGHSFGATTAIELYQLLCEDAFGVGSNHKWVRSIVSIAGPLTGSTVTHMVGLHDAQVMRRGSVLHMIGFVLAYYYKFYNRFPVFKKVFDFRMPQWSNESYWQLTSPRGNINTTCDMAVHSALPARRIERNSQLKHMNKLYLMSIATSPRSFHFPKAEVATFAVMVLFAIGKFPRWWPQWARLRAFRSAVVLVACYTLKKRMEKIDIGKVPTLYGLSFLMRHRVKTLHQIFDGFDADDWQHNDGIVNVQSMIRPWFPKPQDIEREVQQEQESLATNGMTSSASCASLSSSMARCESHISIDGFHKYWEEHEELTTQHHVDGNGTHAPRPRIKRFEKGRWYLYRVKSNHFAGTYFDNDAVDLYKSLFTLMKLEYEQDDHTSPPSAHYQNGHGHAMQPAATIG